jgi:hypothetical protein
MALTQDAELSRRQQAWAIPSSCTPGEYPPEYDNTGPLPWEDVRSPVWLAYQRSAPTPARILHVGHARRTCGPQRRPGGASRSAGGSSGDPDLEGEGEPPGNAGRLALAPPPRAILAFGCLTREQRGEAEGAE